MMLKPQPKTNQIQKETKIQRFLKQSLINHTHMIEKVEQALAPLTKKPKEAVVVNSTLELLAMN